MRPIPAVALAGLFLTGVLAGCTSTPQESRIDKNREIYETWPLDTKQAVLDGKVEQGMTTDMVRVSWGEPTKVVDSNAPGEQVWIYEKGGDPGTMIDPGMGPSPAAIGMGIGPNRAAALMGGAGGMVGPSGAIAGAGVSQTPIYTQPTPPEVREVVFRDGVVYRADRP
jgi:hypothetical protein